MTHNKGLSKKQIGILWMTIPFLGLMVTFLLMSLSGGALSLLISTGAESSGVFQGLGIVFGFLGVVSIVAMLIGIPVGLYFFSRVEPHEVSDLARHAAYEGLSEDQVEYIAKWSWSAFFLHWIWTLCNRGVRFWTLGYFAPLINYYFFIKLSMHGRRMTWESGKWRSFKEFRKRQTILAWVAWIVSILGVIFMILLLTWIPGKIFQAMVLGGSGVDSSAFKEAVVRNESGTALKAADTFCYGLADADEDGVIDEYEKDFNADPNLRDTDGDGFSDGEELQNGYNPGGYGEMTEGQKRLYPLHQSQAKRCL